MRDIMNKKKMLLACVNIAVTVLREYKTLYYLHLKV